VKEDLPENLLGGVKIHFVHTAEEALDIALGKFERPLRAVKGGPSGEDRPMAGPVH